MMSTLRSKIGALLVKPALKQTLKSFDVSEHGGAPASRIEWTCREDAWKFFCKGSFQFYHTVCDFQRTEDQ